MGRFGEERREVVSKTITALLFLLCMAVIFACITKIPDGPLFDADLQGGRLAQTVARTSPLFFLCACVLVFFRPRFGYILGLFAGLIALPWFVRSELSLDPCNSWVLLIQDQDGGGFAAFLKLRILSVTLIVAAIACAAVGLLPAQLCLRKTPVYRRTWPALTIGLTILALWFVHSVTPYVQPVCTRGITPEFEILHLRKTGLQISQTAVSAFKDGKVYVLRDRRQLFRYHFARRAVRGAMPHQALLTFARSPELWKARTAPAKPLLRSWDAERWYVVRRDSKLLVFTTEPPAEVERLLREIEEMPAVEEQSFIARDICLGYRYDLLAEMGHLTLQNRARLLRSQ